MQLYHGKHMAVNDIIIIIIFYLKKKKNLGIGYSMWPFGLRVHVFCFFFARICWLWETNFTVMNSVCTVHTLYYALFTHCIYIVYVLKNIKNGSHDTIYTFKNYFATVSSIFNFQFSVFSNNKFNPNTPIKMI